MALLDFLKKREKEQAGEMTFIDHLEQLRWHLIRSVIAILIGAVATFIYAREIVDKILFAPADKTFITYKWLCDLSHAIGMGDAICLPGWMQSFRATP